MGSGKREPRRHSLLLDRRHRAIRSLMFTAHDNLVRTMREHAVELTSGGVSTKTLQAMGHPFARRTQMRRKKSGKFGTIKNLPINRQRGKLQSALKTTRKIRTLDRQVYDLWFDGRIARGSMYVISPPGTKRMRSRGFWREMEKRRKKENLLSRRGFREAASKIVGST
jgi:hypothetical protein